MAQEIQEIQHPSPAHIDHAEMPERELRAKKLLKINGSTQLQSNKNL